MTETRRSRAGVPKLGYAYPLGICERNLGGTRRVSQNTLILIKCNPVCRKCPTFVRLYVSSNRTKILVIMNKVTTLTRKLSELCVRCGCGMVVDMVMVVPMSVVMREVVATGNANQNPV